MKMFFTKMIIILMFFLFIIVPYLLFTLNAGISFHSAHCGDFQKATYYALVAGFWYMVAPDFRNQKKALKRKSNEV